jgi:hypothetical protein
MKNFIFFVAAPVLLLCGVGQASADYLYDNGPINGTVNAYGIGVGSNALSNSFTLATASNLTNVQVGLWVDNGATPATLDWSLGTTPFGSNIGFGVVAPANTFHNSHSFGNSVWTVFASTFPLNNELSSGTYWLTLKNAQASDGTAVYWDLNFGPSSALVSIPSASSSQSGPYGSEPSESFQIFGSETVTSPEPSSLAMLVIGMASLAGFCWRRRSLANVLH